MSFIEELRRAFDQLHSMVTKDHNDALLVMPYAEFTLKCYAEYADQIRAVLLHNGAPLTRAFDAIGVDQPRDQLVMLLDTFYLHLHAAQNSLS